VSELKVLASGIDTLHLSARGTIRPELWEVLEQARLQAQAEEQLVPVELGDSGQCFNVKGHGLRGYALWLTSPDYELLLGKSERFPAALVQLHAAYLHSMGAEAALDLVVMMLRREIFAGECEIRVSRIDLYADLQGWDLEIDDLRRFVGAGRARRAYPEVESSNQLHTFGRKTTGFVFGRGDLLCRIYDKTAEIRRRGTSWLPDLWGEINSGEPVWRVEFQYRRAVLVEFGLRTLDEALSGVQDLWLYATHDWLSYRTPVRDARVRRWPVDPIWTLCRGYGCRPRSVGWSGSG
jgi:hypothetical protein